MSLWWSENKELSSVGTIFGVSVFYFVFNWPYSPLTSHL